MEVGRGGRVKEKPPPVCICNCNYKREGASFEGRTGVDLYVTRLFFYGTRNED